jgi:hypothetical protein
MKADRSQIIETKVLDFPIAIMNLHRQFRSVSTDWFVGQSDQLKKSLRENICGQNIN